MSPPDLSAAPAQLRATLVPVSLSAQPFIPTLDVRGGSTLQHAGLAAGRWGNGRYSDTQAPDTALTRRVFVLGQMLSVFYHIYSPSTFLWSPGWWRWRGLAPGSLYSSLHCSVQCSSGCGVEPCRPPIEMWSLDNNGRALVPWLHLRADFICVSMCRCNSVSRGRHGHI